MMMNRTKKSSTPRNTWNVPNRSSRRRTPSPLGRARRRSIRYYFGPYYCANEGGQILLGLFTDDICTAAATDDVFEDILGFDLPFERTSIVKESCMQCIAPVREEEDNSNGDQETSSNREDPALVSLVKV